MTRAEINAKLSKLIREQLGTGEMLIEHLFAVSTNSLGTEFKSIDKGLQDALGCTSLEIVSVQLAVEETFGLKFATGPHERTAIDDAWDACRHLKDLEELVEKYTKETK